MLSKNLNYFLAFTTISILLISFISFPILKLSLDFNHYNSIFCLCSILLAITFKYRKKEPRLANTALCVFWGIVFTNAHMIPMFVITRLAGPLQDQILANMDKYIGIEVTEVLAFTSQFPLLKSFLRTAYNSLFFLLGLALILPPLLGHNEQISQFFYALILTTLMGFTLYYLFPAEGPSKYYNYQNLLEPNFGSTLYKIRTSPNFKIDPTYSEGLICAPSFHTILSILAAFSLFPIPWMKWLAAIHSIMIILGTIASGTHYIFDVLAGLIISFISILLLELFYKPQN